MTRHCGRTIVQLLGLALCLALAGPVHGQNAAPGTAGITVASHPLKDPIGCTDTFVAHDLPHTTTTADGTIRMYQANGAGLATGDLDNDGDLDLVLGGEYGPNTLLWNEGDLGFRKTTFGSGPTRMLTLVDADLDDYLDIVLTTNVGAVNYWHNQGDGTFQREFLPGVAHPAYVLAWGDLDRDGDLDLVTGAYDAGFLTDRGTEYLLGAGSGVYVYENRNGAFASPTKLASNAQALALAILDLNRDDLPDLLVGNDFDVPDYAFVQTGAGLGPDGWAPADPFAVTTHSTMSLDMGDVDNDGEAEIFASDMKPIARDPATLAAWMPLMQSGFESRRYRDAQRNENMLQMRNRRGDFRNEAYRRGLDATGWSWSGKFGDLDNDGLLDLYVVNGMIEAEIFAHLPGHELVEENQALRNLGGRYAPAPAWGLNSTRSGRSMIMADLDSDGDLDIVVNNLRTPAQLFENRLCGGESLAVELEWRESANPAALGATVTLQTTAGPLYRSVVGQRGYLSSGPTRLHFGLPPGAGPTGLEIVWPDGARATVPDLTAQTLVRVRRE